MNDDDINKILSGLKTETDRNLERIEAISQKVGSYVMEAATIIERVMSKRFRQDVTKQALKTALKATPRLDATAAATFALTIADKLAPEPREKQEIKPSDVGNARTVLGYKLTDDEAREVAEASNK